MKLRLAILILLATLCASSAFAQAGSPTGANGPIPGTTNTTIATLNVQVANNTSTGTTVNRLACNDGAAKVLICSHLTSTINQALGTVTSGAGTSGTATLCTLGFCPVQFDNQTTVGDYAIASTTIDGELHDAGTALTSGQPNYIVWTANTGAGTVSQIRLLIGDDFITGSNAGLAGFAWGGDGADGALVYDGSTTILGNAPVANVYTLTRSIFPTSMTVNSGVTVIANGFLIIGNGTLTNNGTIHNNGINIGGNQGATAASATGGTGGGGQSPAGNNNGVYTRLSTGPTGGAGGNGSTTTGTQAAAPSTGVISVHPIDSSGGTGQTGASGGAGGLGPSGAGGAQRAGGTGGTAGSTATQPGHAALAAYNGTFQANTPAVLAYTLPFGGNGAPSGGSGGGGDTTNSGGGGGGAGGEGAWAGLLGILFPTITNGSTGTISANGAIGGAGGNGFTPVAGNAGGGGGGGGGNGGMGGIIWLVYHVLTNNGTITVNGGAGGAAGTHGNGIGTGAAGNDGATGVTGHAGIIIRVAE